MACSLKSICPSKFITPAVLEKPTRIPDGCGGFTNGPWVKVQDVFLEFKGGSGSERNEHDRIVAWALPKLTMRFLVDVDETYRMVIDGKPYNIRFIDDVEMRHRFHVIRAELGVDD